MIKRPEWRRPSLPEMMATTGIPVAGVALFGWSGLQILLIFWFENAIIGCFTLLRIALSRPFYRNQADYFAAQPWILQHYPFSEADWERAEASKVPRGPSHKEFFIPLFLGHYTFFLAVHAFLLATLVKRLPASEWWILFPAEWSGGLALAVASIAVSHGWRFWTEDLQGRAYTRSCPFLSTVYPYRRLLILHLALLLAGLALTRFALPAVLAILLVLLKSGFDMNWIRIPFGPKRIDWDAPMGKRKAGRERDLGRTVTERPEGCSTGLTESADSLLFRLSPRGVRRVWRGMRGGGCLLVALVMLGSASGFFMFLIGRLWDFVRDGGGEHYWAMLVLMTGTQILGTFWMLILFATVSVPWSALAYGSARGSIELADARLRIRQRGFPFPRSGDFAAADVADFVAYATGGRTNEFEVFRLCVRLGDGSEHHFFGGRGADELAWITTRVVMRLAEWAEEAEVPGNHGLAKGEAGS